MKFSEIKYRLAALLLAGVVLTSSVIGGIADPLAVYAQEADQTTEDASATSTEDDSADDGNLDESEATDEGDSEDGEQDGSESEEEPEVEIPIESNEIAGWPQGPQVSAESAIVMDAETGSILYAKNIDAVEYPASITKIMTVLLALENCSMDETVTFSHYACFSIEKGSSSIARTEGEELTMEECLLAIMMESANDCANAVAEHIAGSVEAFADMMNQRAAELGCTNTHFVNPHGLQDPDHYTTAHDMALITQAAIAIPKFREISSTKHYNLGPTNKNDGVLTMFNHHSMISTHRTLKYIDETVFAGKTGYTTDALNTLVTCATRNDMDLIVVLMRAPSGTPYPDTADLLTYATDNFTRSDLSSDPSALSQEALDQINQLLPGVDMTAATYLDNSDSYVVLPSGVIPEALTAQVSASTEEDGSSIITIDYTYESQSMGKQYFQVAVGNVPAASGSTDTQQTADSDGNTAENKGTILSVISSMPLWLLIVIGVFAAIIVILLIVLFVMSAKEKQARRRREAKRKRKSKKNQADRAKRKEEDSILELIHEMDDEDARREAKRKNPKPRAVKKLPPVDDVKMMDTQSFDFLDEKKNAKANVNMDEWDSIPIPGEENLEELEELDAIIREYHTKSADVHAARKARRKEVARKEAERRKRLAEEDAEVVVEEAEYEEIYEAPDDDAEIAEGYEDPDDDAVYEVIDMDLDPEDE